ncbi:MAG: ATP-binding protein [Desulfobacteraceae bacterium]|nr:ATP-binding protein [Desulfobacteraceae bacterium]
MTLTSLDIPTHWQVITGAPCSGKTAVIDTLGRQGFRVVPETARAYIEQQLAEERSLSEIKANPLAFERHILMAKVRSELSLPKNERIFMDRAVPDSIAYYQIEGLDPAEPIRFSREVRYQTIFLMERLCFEKDDVRTEDEALAFRLETLLEESYASLGYAIIRVPVMSVRERVEFILDYLQFR